MRTMKLAAIAFAGMVVLAACSDAGGTSTTVGADDSAVTTGDVGSDIAATAAEVQEEVTTLATEIQNSAAAEDLQQSWTELQTEVLAAIAAIGNDGMIDGSAVQDKIDEFQTDLDALGNQAEPALTDAWNTLKERLQGMMS